MNAATAITTQKNSSILEKACCWNLQGQVHWPESCRIYYSLLQRSYPCRSIWNPETIQIEKRESVTVIAVFNDYRANSHEIAFRWQRPIDLVVEKFNPKSLIIPKTIGTSQNNHIITKIHMLNSVLFNLVANCYHPYVRIFSHLLSLPFNFFCRDGIHFSFHGNKVFGMLLFQLMHMAKFYR